MDENLKSKINNLKSPIGYVVGGSLKDNLRVRLTIPAQEVQEGGFVVIESGDWQFYGLVTDLQLGATDPRFADEQSETRLPPELARLLHGQTLYTNLEVLPALMLELGPDPGTPEYPRWREEIELGLKDEPRPLPVKTVPPHHAQVRLAAAGDIAEIFGKSEQTGNFVIGYTREQGHPVCLNLEKFVQRSSGIFGATGTGKSFLTRIILAGLIHYNQASVLIFDMHNEYGFDDTASDTGKRVIGLKTKFGSRVRVVGLGQGSDDPRPGARFQPGDRQERHPARRYRDADPRAEPERDHPHHPGSAGQHLWAQHWFAEFRQMRNGAMIETDEAGKKFPAPDSVAAWANQAGRECDGSRGAALQAGAGFQPALRRRQPGSGHGRRDHQGAGGRAARGAVIWHDTRATWITCWSATCSPGASAMPGKSAPTSSARSGEKEPRPLVIVVEEAHKLLNREMAAQTTFSTIAREMRKYYVTLLIIDQRPSQIYDEVMSQLGTRISGWLGDEDDIRAVLSGLAGREALRGMLARLQPKEEVLLLGWGVPMPLPVRSRRYDEKFWEELLGKASSGKRSEQDILKELGF